MLVVCFKKKSASNILTISVETICTSITLPRGYFKKQTNRLYASLPSEDDILTVKKQLLF